MMKSIVQLVRYDFLLDFRGQFGISSMILFAITISFACLIVLQGIEIEIWNVIFWLILCFAAVLFGMNIYQREGRENRLYYYTLTSVHIIYVAKWIYYFVILLICSCITFFIMTLLSSMPLKHIAKFALTVLLGSACLASILNFTSALASLANGQVVLMSIISFPLIIPTLLLLCFLGGACMGVYSQSDFQTYTIYLLAIAMISFGAGLLLIQNLWKN